MSRDRSLKTASTMASARSVLTRAERISKLIEDKKIEVGKDAKVIGLAKTRVAKK
jgi:small basic protein (TIGR04137 family)